MFATICVCKYCTYEILPERNVQYTVRFSQSSHTRLPSYRQSSLHGSAISWTSGPERLLMLTLSFFGTSTDTQSVSGIVRCGIVWEPVTSPPVHLIHIRSSVGASKDMISLFAKIGDIPTKVRILFPKVEDATFLISGYMSYRSSPLCTQSWLNLPS